MRRYITAKETAKSKFRLLWGEGPEKLGTCGHRTTVFCYLAFSNTSLLQRVVSEALVEKTSGPCTSSKALHRDIKCRAAAKFYWKEKENTGSAKEGMVGPRLPWSLFRGQFASCKGKWQVFAGGARVIDRFLVLGFELKAFTLSHSDSPIWRVFSKQGLTIYPGWLRTIILLLSASWAGSTSGVSHWRPA
jgi:hypothetical protein